MSSALEISSAEYIYPGFTSVYNQIKRSKSNRILDLGNASEKSFKFFSNLSCNIRFDNLTDFIEQDRQLAALPNTACRISLNRDSLENYLSSFQSRHQFDVILAWDLLNYIDLESLRSLINCLSQYSHPGTLTHFVRHIGNKRPTKPCDHQIIDPYRVRAVSPPDNTWSDFNTPSTSHLLKHMTDYYMESSFMDRAGMNENISEHVMTYKSERRVYKKYLSPIPFKEKPADNLPNSNPLANKGIKHRSYALPKICDYLSANPHCKILDLAEKSDANTNFYRQYTNEIHFENLSVHLTDAQTSQSELDDSSLGKQALRYPPRGEKFDLIMAWDLFSYCSANQLQQIRERLLPLVHEHSILFIMTYSGIFEVQDPGKHLIASNDTLHLSPFSKTPRKHDNFTTIRLLKALGNAYSENSYAMKAGMCSDYVEHIVKIKQTYENSAKPESSLATIV